MKAAASGWIKLLRCSIMLFLSARLRLTSAFPRRTLSKRTSYRTFGEVFQRRKVATASANYAMRSNIFNFRVAAAAAAASVVGSTEELIVADRATALKEAVRNFAQCQLGITDTSILASDFQCSTPTELALSKESYLTKLVSETKAIKKAAPDYRLQPYDFQIEPDISKDTVWFKIRPTGTLTANFTFGGQSYAPTNETFTMPVQQLSVRLRDGQVIQMTAEYVVDKFSGDTGGFIGPQGILAALGKSPSVFSYLPPLVALKRSMGLASRKPIRSKVTKAAAPKVVSKLATSLVQQAVSAVRENVLSNETKALLDEGSARLNGVLAPSVTLQPVEPKPRSPFVEAVMFSLTKQIINSGLGSGENGVLLSDDFQYSDPLAGPLSKQEYLNDPNNLYRLQQDKKVESLALNEYSLAIDPFEPDRVWAIVRGTGQRTVIKSAPSSGSGTAPATTKETVKYVGPPEAVSVSFDRKGLCFRITAGYVLDRTQGNTNELGGVYGILEATKQPMMALSTRSIADAFRIAKESVMPRPAPPAAAVKKSSTVEKKSPETVAAVRISQSSVASISKQQPRAGATRVSSALKKPDRVATIVKSETSSESKSATREKFPSPIASPPTQRTSTTSVPAAKKQAKPAVTNTFSLFGKNKKDAVRSATTPASDAAKQIPLTKASAEEPKSSDSSSSTDSIISVAESGSKKLAAKASAFSFFGGSGSSKSAKPVVKANVAAVNAESSQAAATVGAVQLQQAQKKSDKTTEVTGIFGKSFVISRGGGVAKSKAAKVASQSRAAETTTGDDPVSKATAANLAKSAKKSTTPSTAAITATAEAAKRANDVAAAKKEKSSNPFSLFGNKQQKTAENKIAEKKK